MTGPPASSPDYSILSAFQPVVARPRSSILYQFSLLLVTLTMLLLPLIYLALVGAALYGLYYHATHNWSVIMDFGGMRGGRIMILKFLVYIVPLLVGAVVVFFMFKPLFAGRPKHAQPLALNPADNPLLYAFIEKICETVGAPSPKRIDLDCDLNASASFRNGLWSMAGNDMVLTIGLPLVANLSAAEFAGVVAHEFGHFTQSIGMRLSYLIRSVNFWFIRVVYQRDAWDEALEEWSSESEDAWVTIIVMFAQIGVWFARMILRLLMYTGLLIGGFMIRQMEYDADACQIKLVGSETFERTHRKLATLSAAMGKMYKQIHLTWQKNHQLPDNLSELLRQAHESLPPATLQKIEDRYGLERTGLFDSHPSPADRIRRARRAQDAGAFHDERPASKLFASFDHPARFVTMLHYTDELGIPITAEMLSHVQTKSHAPATANRQPDLGVDGTHAEYFLGVLPLLLPLQIASPTPSTDYEADVNELTQLTSGLLQVTDQLTPLGDEYRQAGERLIQARAAVRLIEARAPFKAREFGLSAARLEEAQQQETEALATRDSLRHSVREVGVALHRRLQLGLALKLFDLGELDSDAVTALKQSATSLQSAAVEHRAKLELAEALAVLDRLIALRDSEGESPALTRALAAQTETVTLLRPQPAYLPAEIHAKPTSHLQLSRKPKHEGLSDLESLRQQTRQWFAEYQVHLDRLIDAAREGEATVIG